MFAEGATRLKAWRENSAEIPLLLKRVEQIAPDRPLAFVPLITPYRDGVLLALSVMGWPGRGAESSRLEIIERWLLPEQGVLIVDKLRPKIVVHNDREDPVILFQVRFDV